MDNRAKLVNKLSKDVKKLENKIEHRKLYNIRNYVVKFLLKSGIALDYAFPFILATVILARSYIAKGDAPFHIDEIKVKASIETIDTSSGKHQEHVSYDYQYDEKRIEHSTGWIINKRGLYERTITSYRISDEIDFTQTEEILSMSKEEIEQILVVTNIQTICKNALTPEDQIYDSDAIIVINHTESNKETRIRQETNAENIINSICFIILCVCWGNNVRNIEKIFVKTYVRDKLREYELFLRPINKEELETLKKILELKRQNLEMIETTDSARKNKEYPYQLRKDQVEENIDNQYVLRRI